MNIDYFKCQKYITNNLFTKKAIALKLSLEEFLMLTYFDNDYSNFLNIDELSKNLGISGEKAYEVFTSLLSKKIIDIKTHIVFRMPRFGNRRPPRHDFRVIPHKLFRMDTAFKIQKIGITVQMIEILQKRKVQLLFYIPVLFSLGQNRGQIHGKLFVPDRMLQHALVARF